MINDFVDRYGPLNEYLDVYKTKEGRKVYEETLAVVNTQFPEYVREIEGTADGANVPFFKVNRGSYEGEKNIIQKWFLFQNFRSSNKKKFLLQISLKLYITMQLKNNSF